MSVEVSVAKAAAARHAAEHEVPHGATVGLGSGSTALLFVEALGQRLAAGHAIRGAIATSHATEAAAARHGIPLLAFDEAVEIVGPGGRLDVAVDGEVEVEPAGRMTKGGGASLLREKIVARFARRMVVIADETKRVERLGAFPLPVEVVPFGAPATAAAIAATIERAIGRRVPVAQRLAAGAAVVTDNGNLLFDCRCGTIDDPEALADALSRIPGVVEHGLFLDEAAAFVVGHGDGRVTAWERER